MRNNCMQLVCFVEVFAVFCIFCIVSQKIGHATLTQAQCFKWSKKEAGSLLQSEVECPFPEFFNIYF